MHVMDTNTQKPHSEISKQTTTFGLIRDASKGYRLSIAGFFVLSAFGTVAATAWAFIVAAIIDAIADGQTELDGRIIWLAASFIVLQFVNEWGWRFAEMCARHHKPPLIEKVRKALFDSTLDKSNAYLTDNSSGEIGYWINETASSLRALLDTVYWTLWGSAGGLVVAAFFLLQSHWMLAGFYVLWLVALFAVTWKRGVTYSDLVGKATSERSKASGLVIDSVSNHSELRTFAARTRESEALGRQQRTLLGAINTEWTHNLRTNIAKGHLSVFGLSIGLILALWLYFDGQITAGGFVLFFTYFNAAAFSLWEVAWGLTELFKQSGTIKSCLVGLQGSDERVVIKGPEIDSSGGLPIKFDNVSFAYHDQPGQEVLSGFSLEIAPNESVGIVGESGSGKSTITGILLAMFDPTAGEVIYAGHAHNTLDPDEIRRHIAYVPQETNLFNRSLRENVAYARPDCSEVEIVDALKAAEAYQFVSELPGGLDTVVGERGVKLSGGQKQRIAIARAFLKDAPVLVLDEATSALDSVSERAIQVALARLMQNRSTLVIAHRLSTIAGMDKIIVLDKGEIVQQGTHSELLQEEGAYSQLWQMQQAG